MKEKMLMNPATGSVAPASEWRADYEAQAGKTEWDGEREIELFPEPDLDSLVEVTKDADGAWVEA